MKILEITPYIDPRKGGQEKHVLSLSEILHHLGHDVTILTCDSYSINIEKNIKLVIMPCINFLGLRIISMKQLHRFLIKNKFDVCHLHFQTLFGERVLLTNKLHKLPTVTTLHSQVVRKLPAKFFYDSISLKLISCLSNKVICLSQNLAQNIVKRGLELSKCIIIPNAINVPLLKEKFRKMRKKLSEPEFDVLFVGRLEERKGIRFLLEAFCILHKKGLKYTLRILGRGPLTEELSEYISVNRLSPHVKLLGYVSENQLLKYYLLTKTVVIPSLYEGVPGVALEAMAAEKPIIVSNIPGLKELVVNGRNGLIMNPRDVEGLATAIDQILRSPESLNSIKNTNNKLLAKYDWNIISKKIVKLYQESLFHSD